MKRLDLCKKDVPTDMKMDFKRTFLVGFAFLAITLFWEIYDFAVPILLNRTYGLSAEWRGLIMGLDNLLALFLLPLFGMLSDKKRKGKWGRRMPFIIIGTVCAVAFLIIISFIENAQLNALVTGGVTDANVLVEKGFLDAKYIAEPFLAITNQSPMYGEYISAVSSAQQSMARELTMQSPASLICFVVVLFFLLLSMAVYRSPAVALMPDVTVKPLRSQANAIINFMGGAGGVVSMVLYGTLAPSYGSFTALFIATAVLMLVATIVFFFTVNENSLVERRYVEEKKWEIVDEEEQSDSDRLPKAKFISLILILGTVFLWFMGFNAIKSQLSVYATTQLGFTSGQFSIISIVNSVGGALALYPVALLANKFGRKKTVIVGLIIAVVAFVPAFFITPKSKWLLAVLFIIAGFSLIIVNVNTLPMVVELSKGSNVGKYTGYYYAFSMSAQAITPFIAGLIMENISQNSLFIYGAIMILLGTVTMGFAKHGDTHAPIKKSKLEYFDAD